MIKQIILDELTKYKDDIGNIKEEKTIDCITIFSRSDEDYIELNKELSSNKVIDEMSSGNLYYLDEPIKTIYGDLSFIKIRKHDNNYNNYRISVDFTVENYDEFKNSIQTLMKSNKKDLIYFCRGFQIKDYTIIILISTILALVIANISICLYHKNIFCDKKKYMSIEPSGKSVEIKNEV